MGNGWKTSKLMENIATTKTVIIIMKVNGEMVLWKDMVNSLTFQAVLTKDKSRKERDQERVFTNMQTETITKVSGLATINKVRVNLFTAMALMVKAVIFTKVNSRRVNSTDSDTIITGNLVNNISASGKMISGTV